MYWRIRKITPDIIMRQYGVHAMLIVSVIFNLMLFSKASGSHAAVSASQKTDYDKFVRLVSSQLFDASYITAEDSLSALDKELGPQAKAQLVGTVIPKNQEELKAVCRELEQTKSVSAIKFDSVEVLSPTNRGYLPVDVTMTIVVHDTEGVRPTKMKLRYYCGLATNPTTKESAPIVVDVKQLKADSAQPTPAG